MTGQQIFRATLIVMLTVLCAYIVVVSIQILILLIIAIIVASAIRPVIQTLQKWRIPEGVAIVLVYLGLAAMIFLVAVAIIPPLVNQFSQYIENDSRLSFRIIMAQRRVENLISDVTDSEVSLVAVEDIQGAVSQLSAQVRTSMPDVVQNLGSTIGSAVLIFVMGAYWLTSHKKATGYLTQLAPPHYRDRAQKMVDEIETTMGGYVRGIVTISTIVAILNFVPLQLLGVPNALTLAFIIAVTTAIPMIGGTIGGVLAVALTFLSDPTYVVIVFAVFLINTQIENYILTPRIMSQQVGLDPLLVIVYSTIGFILYGVTGALIAVPIMGTVHILIERLVVEPYQERMQTLKRDTTEGLFVIKPEA
ncbi:MAG: AI-2E family transporter [Aggregatilineales bacterium]